jgi:hypothetical protein
LPKLILVNILSRLAFGKYLGGAILKDLIEAFVHYFLTLQADRGFECIQDVFKIVCLLATVSVAIRLAEFSLILGHLFSIEL